MYKMFNPFLKSGSDEKNKRKRKYPTTNKLSWRRERAEELKLTNSMNWRLNTFFSLHPISLNLLNATGKES